MAITRVRQKDRQTGVGAARPLVPPDGPSGFAARSPEWATVECAKACVIFDDLWDGPQMSEARGFLDAAHPEVMGARCIAGTTCGGAKKQVPPAQKQAHLRIPEWPVLGSCNTCNPYHADQYRNTKWTKWTKWTQWTQWTT